MATRTVTITIATYTDINGVQRIGQQGEQVQVHPDDLKRFSEVNGILEVEAPAKKQQASAAARRAPKKRVPRKR